MKVPAALFATTASILAPCHAQAVRVVDADRWNLGAVTRLELPHDDGQAIATTSEVVPGADRGLVFGASTVSWLDLGDPAVPRLVAAVATPVTGTGHWLATCEGTLAVAARTDRGGLWIADLRIANALQGFAGPVGWGGTEDLELHGGVLRVATRNSGILFVEDLEGSPRVVLHEPAQRASRIATGMQHLWTGSGARVEHVEWTGAAGGLVTHGGVTLAPVADLACIDDAGLRCAALTLPTSGPAEVVLLDGSANPPRTLARFPLDAAGFAALTARDHLLHVVGTAGLRSVDVSDPGTPILDAALRGIGLRPQVSAATTHAALTLLDHRGQLLQVEVLGAPRGYGSSSGLVGVSEPRMRCFGSAGLGSSSFELRCEAGPPNAPVWFLTAHRPMDSIVAGLRVLVDPWNSPGSVVLVTTDAVGRARLPQPVPSAAYYFNRSYYAQAICYDPVGGGFTASHGVTFATHLR